MRPDACARNPNAFVLVEVLICAMLIAVVLGGTMQVANASLLLSQRLYERRVGEFDFFSCLAELNAEDFLSDGASVSSFGQYGVRVSRFSETVGAPAPLDAVFLHPLRDGPNGRSVAWQRRDIPGRE